MILITESLSGQNNCTEKLTFGCKSECPACTGQLPIPPAMPFYCERKTWSMKHFVKLGHLVIDIG